MLYLLLSMPASQRRLMSRPSLRTISTILSALLLPLTMLVSAATGAYYKNNNPDNVDITQGLAYLQQTLVAGVGCFVIILLIIVGLIVMMYRQDKNFINAKLPLVLLSAVVVIIVGTLLVNNYTNQVQDQYLRDNNRPTLKQYFDQVEKQDSK